jgi:hypothetical protein
MLPQKRTIKQITGYFPTTEFVMAGTGGHFIYHNIMR